MSNQELDHLFKNKLGDYTKMPTRDLWSAIDQKVTPTRRKGVYWVWSIAASALLLIGIGIWHYTQPRVATEQSMLVLKERTPKDNIHTSADTTCNVPLGWELATRQADTDLSQNIEGENNPISRIKQKEKAGNTSVALASRKENSGSSTPQKEDVVVEKQPLAIEKPIELIALDNSAENIEKNSPPDATIEKAAASTSKKGKTLVFDISQFSKKPVLASAEEEENKRSKLKKLLKLAKDIKQGESGLSDLRAAKNELFAFNTRKEYNGK